jgi:hypothetical protein
VASVHTHNRSIHTALCLQLVCYTLFAWSLLRCCYCTAPILLLYCTCTAPFVLLLYCSVLLLLCCYCALLLCYHCYQCFLCAVVHAFQVPVEVAASMFSAGATLSCLSDYTRGRYQRCGLHLQRRRGESTGCEELVVHTSPHL